MQLYLIRHAHALDAADDDVRPLSRQGHEQVAAVASLLARSGAMAPVEIWHSPLVRARETASGLATALRLKAKLVPVAGLRPEDDPVTIAQRLKTGPASLALVGHEPHLSALASLLVAGPGRVPVFVFNKCAVLALEGAADYWAVRWHITPELLQS